MSEREQKEQRVRDLVADLDSSWSAYGDWQMAKIFEDLIVTLKDATAVTFISKFIAWIKNAAETVEEVVAKRAAIREEIERLKRELDEEQ